VAEKETYLTRKEVVNSVADAQTQLTLLEAYDKEKVSTTTVSVAQFKQLGAEILAQVYTSQYSEWKFETPEDISSRHAAIDAGMKGNNNLKFKNVFIYFLIGWEKLSALSAIKKEILQDDLARELFKEKVRLLNEEHIDKHDKLQAWADEQEDYLKTREEVLSVNEAHTQLSLFEVYQVPQIISSFKSMY
jgi:hypothetical protein